MFQDMLSGIQQVPHGSGPPSSFAELQNQSAAGNFVMFLKVMPFQRSIIFKMILAILYMRIILKIFITRYVGP